MAGAKKKLPKSSIVPYWYAAPGEPIKPQPLNPVATTVPAMTKGPNERPATKKPLSSSADMTFDALLANTMRSAIAANNIIQLINMSIPRIVYCITCYDALRRNNSLPVIASVH